MVFVVLIGLFILFYTIIFVSLLKQRVLQFYLYVLIYSF